MSDPTEDELFLEATVDETDETEPTPETDQGVQPDAEPGGEPEAKADTNDQAEPGDLSGEGEGADPDQPEPTGETIPMGRFSEVNERRKAAEEQLAALQEQNTLLTKVVTELQQNRGQQPAPQNEPDQEQVGAVNLWDDPDAFMAGFEKRVNGQIQEVQLRANLQAYQAIHGETFMDAFNTLLQSGDQDAAGKVLAAPNPGQAVLDWHKQHRLLSETGGDIDAYKSKLLDQIFEDPETLKKLGQKLAAQNGSGNGAGSAGGNKPIIDLPPSLSGGSSGLSGAESVPETEEEIFQDAVSGR